MAPEKELRLYQTVDEHCPFEEWLVYLKDKTAAAAIRARLDRLTYYGHAGSCEPVGCGVFELKINYGPGYRVYFIEDGRTVIILLCGGIKKSQGKDIRRARRFAEDYKKRKQEE